MSRASSLSQPSAPTVRLRAEAQSFLARRGLYLLIGIGVALRLARYAADRSLDLDEALIALNITNRSFAGFFHQLDFNSGAPIAFLEIEKLMVTVFGNNEYALRLFPLLAGIAALLLFPSVASRVVSPAAVPLALALFVILDRLIYYSSAVKQYSSDVAVTLALYALALRFLSGEQRPRCLALLAFAGILAPWLSHPSVFVLAAIATTLGAESLMRRDWRRLRRLALVVSVFAVSGAAIYFAALADLTSLRTSLGGESGAYPSSLAELKSLGGAFRWLLGTESVWVGGIDAGDIVALAALALLLCGAVCLLRSRKTETALLVLPAAFAGAAALLHAYPLVPRTLLFLVPAVVLGVSEGAIGAVRWVRQREAKIVLGAVAATVLVFSALSSMTHAAKPDRAAVHELRPLMAYLASHQRPGDTVYLYFKAQYIFRYYVECDCGGRAIEKAKLDGLWPVVAAEGGPDQWAPALVSKSARFVVGAYRGNGDEIPLADLERLRGRKHVWILVVSMPLEDRSSLRAHLDRIGERRLTLSNGMSNSAATLYLYDLR